MSHSREVLGVSRLPPGWVAEAVNRVRATLGRTRRQLAPPPLRIVEGALAHLDTVALAGLCRLGIPEHLDRAMSVVDLADACVVDREIVERLIRFAATRGWVRLDRRGRVAPTATTVFLRSDHPGGWRAWVEFAGGPEVMAAAARFAIQPAAHGAFAQANGAAFFDWQLTHRDRHRVFDAAMAAGGRMHGLALAAALEWSDARVVCDVGGGNGALLRMLLTEHPHLRGVVVDLPAVLAEHTQHPRLTAMPGDAFVKIPRGCDTYLLVNVIHDWSDDEAVRLLANTARAMSDAGRVIVVEGERSTRPFNDVAASTDILMLVLTDGGHERTTTDIAALANYAGLVHQRSVTLASADRAHVFTRR